MIKFASGNGSFAVNSPVPRFRLQHFLLLSRLPWSIFTHEEAKFTNKDACYRTLCLFIGSCNANVKHRPTLTRDVSQPFSSTTVCWALMTVRTATRRSSKALWWIENLLPIDRKNITEYVFYCVCKIHQPDHLTVSLFFFPASSVCWPEEFGGV